MMTVMGEMEVDVYMCVCEKGMSSTVNVRMF